MGICPTNKKQDKNETIKKKDETEYEVERKENKIKNDYESVKNRILDNDIKIPINKTTNKILFHKKKSVY